MVYTKNTILIGKHNKPILTDIYYINNNSSKPILIFCHGYKGFKDWGAWNDMATSFAKKGMCFIKFNFAFNGGTVDQPIDFPDLEAFGNNNYTKELDDLDTVLNWIEQQYKNHKNFDTSNIILLGHSRGGGIVTIKAEEDSRISKVISLAGVCDYKNRFPKGSAFDTWKKNGVYYVVNGRTQQNMPHFFQFYENFTANEERLSIKRAVKNLKIPYLILHGDSDTSVLPLEAENLHSWNPNSRLQYIKNADHVFNTYHPWDKKEMPQELQEVIDTIIKFVCGA